MTKAQTTLTNAQRRLTGHLDNANALCIKYAAPEIPALGNLTPQGLNEDLGCLNVARKAIEKTEKIVKERLKALRNPAEKEIRSDNFVTKFEIRTSNRLSQELLKVYCEKHDIDISQFYTDSDAEYVTVKEL